MTTGGYAEKSNEEDNGYAIIEERFANDLDFEAFGDACFFQDGHDRDGIGGGYECAEQKGFDERDVEAEERAKLESQKSNKTCREERAEEGHDGDDVFLIA